MNFNNFFNYYLFIILGTVVSLSSLTLILSEDGCGADATTYTSHNYRHNHHCTCRISRRWLPITTIIPTISIIPIVVVIRMTSSSNNHSCGLVSISLISLVSLIYLWLCRPSSRSCSCSCFPGCGWCVGRGSAATLGWWPPSQLSLRFQWVIVIFIQWSVWVIFRMGSNLFFLRMNRCHKNDS